MNDLPVESQDNRPRQSLPRLQRYFLLAILIAYPAISVCMNLLRTVDQAKIVSKINQIYLPSLAIQLLLLAIVTYVLYFTGTRFGEIGLSRSDINWSNALSGIIFFVGAWTLIILVRSAIEKSGYIPEKDFLYLLPSTTGEKAVWLCLSVGAAFSEEIIFRGFVISRIKILSGSLWFGAIMSSAAFSLGHLYQGMAGVILTFIYGMLFAGLYIARQSVYPCIVAHFLQDALILLAFRG